MITVSDLLVEFKEKPGQGEEPPVLTLTERNGFVRQADRFNKRLATEDISGYKVVRQHDIAFNPYLLWAGAVAQNTIVDAGVISPLYPTFRVREDHDPRYVARLLLTPQMLGAYDQIAFGSVPRRRRTSVKDFLALPLPALPAIHEQRRIAAILDHADALRAKRHQVLAHLDDLTQSIFLDMFGSPLSKEATISRVAIGSVATVVTGNSPSRGDNTNFGEDIEWIKSDNLGGVYLTAASEGLSTLGCAKARVAPARSVLVSCIAGSEASIGKASIADRDVAFNQQINAILPSEALNPWFLLWQLKVAPELVRRKSTGGMKGMVSKSAFQAIEVLLPSTSRQVSFVDHAERVNRHRGRAARAVKHADELFASLQSRAFRGEL